MSDKETSTQMNNYTCPERVIYKHANVLHKGKSLTWKWLCCILNVDCVFYLIKLETPGNVNKSGHFT